MSSLQICKSLHISSILTCPSSVSWLYIIFHMKTNIHKYLIKKKFPTKIKTYTATSSPNCQLLSTLFCPHLLHPLQIYSTHSKFAPPTPKLLHPLQNCSIHSKIDPPTPNCSTHSKLASPTPNLLRPLIFRRLAHVSTLYQYKTKTHKSWFFCQTQIDILFRYCPHPLRSLILHIHSAPLAHSPHHATHSYRVLDKGEKMHMKQSSVSLSTVPVFKFKFLYYAPHQKRQICVY